MDFYYLNMPQLKPYLIRAIYDWITDSALTPYLMVDANNGQAILPMDFIEDGKIILNVRPSAVQNLALENDHIEFDARFSGNPMHIFAPIEAVLAIFAQENGEGMFFDQPEDNINSTQTIDSDNKTKLRIIK